MYIVFKLAITCRGVEYKFSKKKDLDEAFKSRSFFLNKLPLKYARFGDEVSVFILEDVDDLLLLYGISDFLPEEVVKELESKKLIFGEYFENPSADHKYAILILSEK